MKTHKILIGVLGAAAFAVPALADDSSTQTPTPTPSAQQQCRTERTGMGKAAFADLYGTNKSKSNAFGKCVSKRSKATEAAQEKAQANAAKQCKAERAADPTAFATKYGTNKNHKNAYGKCVSGKAKAQTDKTVSKQVESDIEKGKEQQNS